jgi:hypothetical protein
VSESITPAAAMVLAGSTAVFFLPKHQMGFDVVFGPQLGWQRLRSGAALLIAFPLALVLVATSSYTAFLYFQF